MVLPVCVGQAHKGFSDGDSGKCGGIGPLMN